MARAPANTAFQIGDEESAPSERRIVDLPISLLSDHTQVNLSVEAVNGKQAGPILFVSGAIHGDEFIGVEIIRRALASAQMSHVRGTLLAVPCGQCLRLYQPFAPFT